MYNFEFKVWTIIANDQIKKIIHVFDQYKIQTISLIDFLYALFDDQVCAPFLLEIV